MTQLAFETVHDEGEITTIADALANEMLRIISACGWSVSVTKNFGGGFLVIAVHRHAGIEEKAEGETPASAVSQLLRTIARYRGEGNPIPQ